MTSPKSTSAKFKESLTTLAGFFNAVILYCIYCVPMEKQTVVGMLWKCLPIVALQYFVYKHGNIFQQNKDGSAPYGRKIFIGLIFACIGDAFLDFPDYFLHGTVAFGISQMCYISAYGFDDLKFGLGVKVFLVMGFPITLIWNGLMQHSTCFITIVSIYAPTLKTMVWRALARIDFSKPQLASVFAAIGAVSFGLSDSYLALNKFYTPLPYAQGIIMATYYCAQLGIALSVLTPDSPSASAGDSSKKKRK